MVKLFRSQFMLLGGLMLLISANARAAGPISGNCDKNVAECQALRAQVDARIKELQAGQMPAFLDIARDANGKVKYMKQNDAVQYCANQGAHLPSARELAQLSMSLGATGIVDTCGTDQNCYKVSNIQNADGSKDEFYFSYSGYQRPAGDLGNNWFWSSSVYSNYSDFAFDLYGYVGDVDYVYRSNYIYVAVRCVSGR